MELRQLKYFMMVGEKLHFGKAAESLHMSQPPLSRQIKQLEDELGVELFKRDKKKVVLTDEGKYLLAESGRILQQLQLAKSGIKEIATGQRGQIKIGYVGAAMHCILPDILVALKREHSEIKTMLNELSNEDQIRALRNGDIDVGFIRATISDPHLDATAVYEETFSLVLPKGHKRARDGENALQTLEGEPFLSFSKHCAPQLIESIFSIFSKAGFSPQIVHEASQLNSILRLVEAGLGYSIVPTSVKQGYALDVEFIELTSYKERAHLSMVSRKSEHKQVVNTFVQLTEAWAKELK